MSAVLSGKAAPKSGRGEVELMRAATERGLSTFWGSLSTFMERERREFQKTWTVQVSFDKLLHPHSLASHEE